MQKVVKKSFKNAPSARKTHLYGQEQGYRQGCGIGFQYARTDPRKYSFAVRTFESWNKLPEIVKAAETGESFKRRLRGKPE
jgi:hypothetical protein